MTAIHQKNVLQPTALNTWKSQENAVEVRRGSDWLIFNVARNIALIPAKLTYWNAAYGSGSVSEEAAAKVVQCLEDYNLQDVAVQVNDYAPAWYANRVVTNSHTGILSKLVFGLPAIVANFFGMHKIWAADHYDVMSNSVYLSSNDGDVGLLEAGRAKIFNESSYPVIKAWTPALITTLFNNIAPFNTLLGQGWQLSQNLEAKKTAMDWAQEKGTIDETARTYATQTPIATFGPIANMSAALAATYAIAKYGLELTPASTIAEALNVLANVASYQVGAVVLSAIGIHAYTQYQASQIRKEDTKLA